MVKSVSIGPKEFNIPNNWDIKTFGELVDIIKGHSYKSKYYSDKEDNEAMIFISLKSINKYGGFNKEGIKYYKEDINEKKKVKSGEVIIGNTDLNRDAEVVGYPIFVPDFDMDKEICISMDVSVLRLKNEKELLERYFYYLLSTKKVHNAVKAFAEGSTVLHLDLDSFSKINLPIPPLSEQKKIASILSSVDKSIEKTDEVIEETKKLKKGLMQELLTKGIGYSEFKEVKALGKKYTIPEEWRLKELNEVLTVIRNGSSKKQNQQGKGLPVSRIETISDGTINYDKVGYVDVEPEDLNKHELEKGDILFSHINSVAHIGKVAQYKADKKLYHGMNLLKLRFDNEKVTDQFMLHRLKSVNAKHFYERYAKQAVNQASLNQKDVGLYTFPVPPLKEQKKIASILSSVDAKIQKEEEYKAKLERLKKGLMQKLLTGEVRVNTEMEV